MCGFVPPRLPRASAEPLVPKPYVAVRSQSNSRADFSGVFRDFRALVQLKQRRARWRVGASGLEAVLLGRNPGTVAEFARIRVSGWPRILANSATGRAWCGTRVS